MTAWVGNQVWARPDGSAFYTRRAQLLSRLRQLKKAQPYCQEFSISEITQPNFYANFHSNKCYSTVVYQSNIQVILVCCPGLHQKSGRSSVSSVGFLNVRGQDGGWGGRRYPLLAAVASQPKNTLEFHRKFAISSFYSAAHILKRISSRSVNNF